MPNLVTLLATSLPSIHDCVQIFCRLRGLVKIVVGGGVGCDSISWMC